MHHIGPVKRMERAGANRAAILCAFWALIAVTLLSALAPLGPPLSRAKGSAFNPATSEVVLKSRAQAVKSAGETTRPDDDDSRPRTALWSLLLVVLLAIVRAVRIAPVASALHDLTRVSLTGAHRARAPPASF